MARVNEAAVDYHLLGTFSVFVNGQELRFGGVKQRSVLAMLLLEANHPVSISRLIEGLWADEVPDRALSTIQVYVSGIRKLLPRQDGASPIVTRTNGYMLQTANQEVDLQRFRSRLEAARECSRRGDYRAGLDEVDAGLEIWHGEPLADFIDQPFAAGQITPLEEERYSAQELRYELMVRAGQHNEVMADLERSIAETPLRESLWRLLMLAQYRAGRPADALEAYKRCRKVLVDSLGIDPSPQTQALEMAVLSHDPVLVDLPPKGRGAERTIPAGSVATLAIKMDGGRRSIVRSTIVIGRSDECDVVVDDAYVSRRHAEIRKNATGWILADLSMNGTLINGVVSSEHLLAPGDTITIGSRTIEIESAE